MEGSEKDQVAGLELTESFLLTKNGATVYVTKCQPVEVVPRQHTDCTNEIPVTFNDTEVFVDPISLVIKAGRTWDGSATPAVQWGSVPRRLF